jgi:hypothetical protein
LVGELLRQNGAGPFADHHRHEAVPHRGDTGQEPAVGLVDAMSLGGGAGAAGWWSWTISPDGVSWSCSNCVTIFTRTTGGDGG